MRKICVISTLDSRFILHQNAHRLGQELQRSSVLRATTLAESTQLLRALRAEKKCGDFATLSRELGGKICGIPTLDAILFESECNTDSINSQRRCEVCAAHAGRVHAIFVRGACRISGNFANFSRDFCAKFASSRRWTRALSCIRTHADSKKSCNEVLRFAQPRWPSSRNFCARGAPKFFGNFEISFARVRRKTCVIPTPDAFFFGSECNYDSINSQRRNGVRTESARWPSARIFCARGVPDFRKFCKFFARILRKICVIPTLDSRFILH